MSIKIPYKKIIFKINLLINLSTLEILEYFKSITKEIIKKINLKHKYEKKYENKRRN
jgi:hypothetical protein